MTALEIIGQHDYIGTDVLGALETIRRRLPSGWRAGAGIPENRTGLPASAPHHAVQVGSMRRLDTDRPFVFYAYYAGGCNVRSV